jgi:hypothetical protein
MPRVCVWPHHAGVTDSHRATPFGVLCLGALGVVFGDIGTSPLYTLKECVRSAGGATEPAILGVLSMIVWALFLVVTVKYLLFIMRADNKGEGGIFALLALVPSRLRANRAGGIALLVIIGAALLYGDGAITPAISVLSAVDVRDLVCAVLDPAPRHALDRQAVRTGDGRVVRHDRRRGRSPAREPSECLARAVADLGGALFRRARPDELAHPRQRRARGDRR